MINDGLWDAYENFHMGMTGELVAEKYGITREEQDKFAVESHQKAVRARKSCFFEAQILPIEDRKSTRLNSSHVRISYAVFCLKKKEFITPGPHEPQVKTSC